MHIYTSEVTKYRIVLERLTVSGFKYVSHSPCGIAVVSEGENNLSELNASNQSMDKSVFSILSVSLLQGVLDAPDKYNSERQGMYLAVL